MRQILSVHDRGESPCGHVGRVLADRLDHVRAQIAELVTLETDPVNTSAASDEQADFEPTQ
ncbi:MerR family DNA-binding protein [Streptomyces inhibens]|uniref:MerR family DNA-binding protein n=1 Tax=Streptomyces inhibens TaxID=2293571 RepID=UPI001C6EAFA8|nr:MerR family DNA-binding protein [Streptomyces inhibens]